MNSITRRGALALTLAAAAPGGLAQAEERAVFPFRVTRNIAWTGVSLNGKGPFPFTLDTGANSYLITPELVAQLGLLNTNAAVRSQTAGGLTTLRVYDIKEIVIGGAVRDFNVPVIELHDRTLDLTQGIVPTSNLASVGFDFDAEKVTVARALAAEPAGYAPVRLVNEMRRGGFSRSDLTSEQAQAVIRAELDGQPVRLMVDTGASTSLYLFGDYVRARNLWDRDSKAVEGKASTVGGVVSTRLVRMKQLKLAGAVFKDVPAHLAEPHATYHGADSTDGLIGMELLRRLNFVIAPERRQIWFKPSKAMDDVYRYDRAGLGIDKVGAEIRVTSVHPGSPAARAGLVRGDKVTGWAGQGGYFGLLWALQGPPGDVVRIQVERAGAPTVLAVTLEERV
jgi:predicted aspartyl protease